MENLIHDNDVPSYCWTDFNFYNDFQEGIRKKIIDRVLELKTNLNQDEIKKKLIEKNPNVPEELKKYYTQVAMSNIEKAMVFVFCFRNLRDLKIKNIKIQKRSDRIGAITKAIHGGLPNWKREKLHKERDSLRHVNDFDEYLKLFKELYESLNKLIVKHTHQVFSRHIYEKKINQVVGMMDEVIDSLIGVFDVGGLLSIIKKEDIKGLDVWADEEKKAKEHEKEWK